MAHRTLLLGVAACFMCAAAASPLSAQTTIGTGFSQSHGTSFDIWTGCLRGESCWYSGQTFTAPTDAHGLSAFSLGLYVYPDFLRGGEAYDARLSIMAWDGTNGTGPLLVQAKAASSSTPYDRAHRPLTPTAPTRFDWVFEAALALTPGAQYLAFFTSPTALVDPGGIVTTDGRPAGYGDAYDGGSWVLRGVSGADYKVDAPPPTWQVSGSRDLEFTADFVSVEVPEPRSWLLLLSGFIGLALTGGRSTERRRRI